MNQECTSEIVVDLSKFQVDGEYDFSSRASGLAVRTKSNISLYFEKFDKVEIRIPAQVYTMSNSFWKELLGNIILDLGKEKFLQKVELKSEGRYEPWREVNKVVEEISEFAIAQR